VESQQRSAGIAIAKVVLKPGGSTGWHHIPGVTLVSVASGTVAVYDVKCEKTVFTAGKGFIEDRNQSHVLRNHGKVDAVLYTTLIAPTKLLKLPFEELRMDDPKPKNCKVS
jgi:quercetin dioxygenase-like cupin family protein